MRKCLNNILYLITNSLLLTTVIIGKLSLCLFSLGFHRLIAVDLQKIGAVCGLLASMKLMCLHLWPQEVATIDELRLDVVLRLLKSAHFNARMNSLKEVSSSSHRQQCNVIVYWSELVTVSCQQTYK